MKNGYFRRLSAAACAALVLLSAGLAPAADRTLSGHVPAAIAKLGLAAVKHLPATNTMQLAISLPVRNQAALDLLQRQISDPASPNYKHYLTPAEFAAQFGATEQDYQTVADFAQAHGLTITATHPNRLVLDVSGRVSDIEAAFQIKLMVYNHPTEARTFYAPTTEPVINASLPILNISGLNNYYLPHSQMKLKSHGGLPGSQAGQANGSSPNSGSGPGGGYSASDLRTAYVPGTTLTGVGQSVALLEFDGFFANDVAQYASASGLLNPPQVITIPIDGGVSSPSSANVEVAMDIEMIMALAPGVSTIYVYETPNNATTDAAAEAQWIDMLSRMANDNLALQLSCSWGIGINPIAGAEQIFQQMAVQGQTFYNAVGDTAAFIPSINPPDFPSDSTNITQVGGTELTTSSSGAYTSETVWNTPNIPRENTYQGSCGGVSLIYPIPYWQTNISMAANGGSTTNRNMPDVALIADNIWIVYDDGVSGPDGGGTSSAAPLWAAFTALVNQQAAGNGKPPVGFINPALYALASNPVNYSACFHDITTGGNTNSFSPTNYLAVAGYDLCTGLGTPNGLNLIYALAGRSPATGFLQASVNPSSGSTLVNSSNQTVLVTVNNGGFNVTNATITAVVSGGGNLTFTNTSKPAGAVYGAVLAVPSSVSSLTMTVTATAPNVVGTTNVVYYSLVPLPSNDNFANATKVPVAGGTYLANNRFATIETNEPAHDGDRNDAASLWWSWTPTATTNVLIDTIGSKIDNVLAVYTGSALLTLKSVAATNGSAAQFKPAHVSFNAQAGVTYRIAVAGSSSSSLGSLVLHITPGGQLDTVAPSVSVINPLNGLTVTSQGILVSGIAADPTPNASGVSQVTVTANGIATIATGTTNWTAPIALQPALNIVQVSAVDAAGNVSSPVIVNYNYLVPTVANDFFVNAILLTNTSGVVSMGSTNASKEVGEPDIAGNPGGKSIWWSFTAPSDGVLTLNTTNSTFDTLLGLFTGTNVANLTAIAENDDAYPGAPGGFSFINQAVRSNQVYSIAVDGFDGAAGTVSLSYSFVPATVYSLNAGNNAGGSVQLTITNSLGGIATMLGQSADFAAGSAVTLTAVSYATSQFNDWSGDVPSSANPLANPLTVVVQTNLNLTANFGLIPYTDGFESGGLSQLSWITNWPGSNLPWFVQTSVVDQGQYAARSGIITDSQTSSLVLITNFTAGIGSFDFKVSSETNFDVFNFSVDGVLYKQWSGQVGWANYSFALTAGPHTLEWSYVKDPSISIGLDAAFIDDVNLPLSSGAYSGPPPQLQLQLQNDGSFVMTVTNQATGSCVIQTSTNLVNWQSISTNPATGGSIQIAIPANPASPELFYRAVAY